MSAKEAGQEDIWLQTFGVTVRIVCRGNFRFPNVVLVYSHFLVNAPNGHTFVTLEVHRESGVNGYSFSVLRNGIKTFGPGDYGECGRFLIKNIQDEARASLPSSRYLVLHGGCVERRGGATVMPARSQSGKSTLVAGSIIEGFRYMSDELVAVDLESGSVKSFPLALKLRDDVIDVFSENVLRGVIDKEYLRDSDPEWHMNYVQLRRRAVVPAGESKPIAQIVFPRYDPTVEVRIAKLLPADGVRRLLLCTRDASMVNSMLLYRTLSLLKSVGSYEIVGRDPLKMATAIDNLRPS